MNYAKIVVMGSPISKSNFKLFNIHGRAILPYNSGKYHDRYANYEQQIAYEAKSQNPATVLSESLIAVLKVYYKSSKRHPDTNNITKSIFDGIEKSGIIINDAQIRRLIIEEYYDSVSPRFELELFGESVYHMKYSIDRKSVPDKPINYDPPSNKKSAYRIPNKKIPSESTSGTHCEICGKTISENQGVSINNGKAFICKDCLKRSF